MNDKYNKKMPFVWVIVLLFASPVALMSQDLKWADVNTQNEYKTILEWQMNKSKYDDLAAECKNKMNEAKKLQGDEATLIQQKQDLQKKVATIYPNARKMYEQCDVEMLKRHKGMLGNQNAEAQLVALLVCHQAEKSLTKRYDEKAVNNVRENLKNPQVIVKEVANDIDTRLRLYAEKTNNLKKALRAAADTLNVNIPKGNLSEKTKEKLVKEFFFDELEKQLDPELLDPKKYPFLHQKLMEATQLINVLKDGKIMTDMDLKQIVNQTITKIINEL